MSRKAEMAALLAALRDWAWVEAKAEPSPEKQNIWLNVRDWALGAAAQKKLNLDAVPLALKATTWNGSTASTTRPGGPETAHRERRDGFAIVRQEIDQRLRDLEKENAKLTP